ncbi:MAG: hypothetical protein HY880_07385 [Deltaproteobacteria bacterium]|nr:hypothetical protein [Deltaproteobacteria bacterium]
MKDIINDCSIDRYNKYRRLEQLQDPDTRELYLETVAFCVQTETIMMGRNLTSGEIREIEENVNVLNDIILPDELEFDLLTEHIRKGLPYPEAVKQARESASSIFSNLFDERLN